MPRCSHCGKVNREGSLFCQDCGHRLEAQASPQAGKPQPQAGPQCGSCGTVNPPGMNFCKMCGTSLASRQAVAATMMADAPPPSVAREGAPGKISCTGCGKQTPAGFAFCQHCGQRLGAAPAQAVSAPPSVAAAQAVSAVQRVAQAVHMNPTPPAGMLRPGVDEATAKTMAKTPEMQAPRAPAAQPVPNPAAEPYKSDTLREPGTPARAASDEKRIGALVAVNRDGTDGNSVPIAGETFDIGRTEGSLNFGDDSYLAPRHARLFAKDGKVLIRAIDQVNGVYLRVHGACDLSPGDQFLVGKEVLRYEPLLSEERDPPSLVEHGVRYFGSTPREAWGRLRQLTVAGTTRDVWHLTRPELVLGREEGDVTFPDDEFMSRRHAAVKRVGAKARLEDLNSSNGTFVRVKGDRELKAGDVLRLGDQLMRFEP